jgi:hypothetical protein
MLDLLQRLHRAVGESGGGGGWVMEMSGRAAGCTHRLEKSAPDYKDTSIHRLSKGLCARAQLVKTEVSRGIEDTARLQINLHGMRDGRGRCKSGRCVHSKNLTTLHAPSARSCIEL